MQYKTNDAAFLGQLAYLTINDECGNVVDTPVITRVSAIHSKDIPADAAAPAANKIYRGDVVFIPSAGVKVEVL